MAGMVPLIIGGALFIVLGSAVVYIGVQMIRYAFT